VSCCETKDFCVGPGETFHPVIRWGSTTLTSIPITGISQAAPAVVTALAHGMPDGWSCAVVAAQGSYPINALYYPPRADEWRRGTVLTADTVQLNAVSSADAVAYKAGGFLVYPTPTVLTGVAVALTIYDNPGRTGTPLATLTSPAGGVTVDPVGMTINPLLQTAGLTWSTGYYVVDATDGSGVVTQLMTGVLTIQ
jgi:hypothetical protein